MTYRYAAGLWHQLMRGLGYARYAAGGGDFGSGIATFMALDDPGPLTGLHLTNLELTPWTGPGSRPLSAAERPTWTRPGGGTRPSGATPRSSPPSRRPWAMRSTTPQHRTAARALKHAEALLAERNGVGQEPCHVRLRACRAREHTYFRPGASA